MTLEKAKCSTPDFAEETRKKLLELVPECAGEDGEVDFDKLRQCLSSKVIEGNVERYEFTWPGKRAAKAAASTATSKTLRPCREDSVDFDTTGNLYIEGDNLEVLKLLQTNYSGKIKLIYIDPPYNTGQDFIYRDRFSLTQQEVESAAGTFDEDGNRFEKNESSEARYHSNWCSMMWPRLKLARNLLRHDGVIFISIDDNEVTNLRRLCDEVFGEKNFLCDFIWNSTKSVTNTALVSVSHTYTLVYARELSFFVEHRNQFRLPEDGEGFSNPDNDPRGAWKADPFQVGGWRPNQQYEIVNPNTGVVYRPNPGCSWKNDFTKFQELLADNRIVFGVTGDAGPQRKRFIWEAQERGKVSKTWWEDVETTTNGTQQLKKLFDGKSLFNNPKPVGLLDRILRLAAPSSDALILDFFSGSGTTAHAVMQLNAEDGGKRKFIMVQLPEACDDEAKAAGYETICEIGKERIRRAGSKIKEEAGLTAQGLDIGFRVLKLDSSSLRETAKTVGDTVQGELDLGRIRDDRTPEDVLFQLLLETRIPLSDRIATAKVGGNDVFFVGLLPGTAVPAVGAPLVACLDPKAKMDSEFFMAIAQLKPEIAFFRDDAFADDSARTNLEQLFRQFSPSTRIKVI